jgi:hypothetical protein
VSAAQDVALHAPELNVLARNRSGVDVRPDSIQVTTICGIPSPSKLSSCLLQNSTERAKDTTDCDIGVTWDARLIEEARVLVVNTGACDLATTQDGSCVSCTLSSLVESGACSPSVQSFSMQAVDSVGAKSAVVAVSVQVAHRLASTDMLTSVALTATGSEAMRSVSWSEDLAQIVVDGIEHALTAQMSIVVVCGDIVLQSPVLHVDLAGSHEQDGSATDGPPGDMLLEQLFNMTVTLGVLLPSTAQGLPQLDYVKARECLDALMESSQRQLPLIVPGYLPPSQMAVTILAHEAAQPDSCDDFGDPRLRWLEVVLNNALASVLQIISADFEVCLAHMQMYDAAYVTWPSSCQDLWQYVLD